MAGGCFGRRWCWCGDKFFDLFVDGKLKIFSLIVPGVLGVAFFCCIFPFSVCAQLAPENDGEEMCVD